MPDDPTTVPDPEPRPAAASASVVAGPPPDVDAAGQRWDDELGAGLLRPSGLLALVRAKLLGGPVEAGEGAPLPVGVAAVDGRLRDGAAACAATLAAPLLHVTVDRQGAGTTDRVQVRWAPTAAVATGPDGAAHDAPQRVVAAAADAFASLVVEAMELSGVPAAPDAAVCDPRVLARAIAAGADAPAVAGTPADRLQLVTAAIVAPADAADLQVLTPPGPQPGTQPVSRALLIGDDGSWRVEATDATGSSLRLVPWSGADERAWFAEVVAGVATSLDAG